MKSKLAVGALGALAIAGSAPAGAAAACSTSIYSPTVRYESGGAVKLWGAARLQGNCDHAVALFMERNGSWASITSASWFVGNINGTAYSNPAGFACSSFRGYRFRSGLLRRGGSWSLGPINTPCR